MTEAGCVFSYSVSIKDMWYRSAAFVDKILKWAKPSDLPVQQGRREEATKLIEGGMSQRQAAKALGVDHKTICNDLRVGKNSPEEKKTSPTKSERRAQREIELASEQVALPAKRYGVIVALPDRRDEDHRGSGCAGHRRRPRRCSRAVERRAVSKVGRQERHAKIISAAGLQSGAAPVGPARCSPLRGARRARGRDVTQLHRFSGVLSQVRRPAYFLKSFLERSTCDNALICAFTCRRQR